MKGSATLIGTFQSLLCVLDFQRSGRWIELTHAFDPSIPHCRSFEPEKRRIVFSYDSADGAPGWGFLAHEYCLVGQWGTHVDPPAHFVKGLRFHDDIPVREVILPAVVIDNSRQVARDPDYCVTMTDIRDWERQHGPVPTQSFVAIQRLVETMARSGSDVKLRCGRYRPLSRMEIGSPPIPR